MAGHFRLRPQRRLLLLQLLDFLLQLFDLLLGLLHLFVQLPVEAADGPNRVTDGNGSRRLDLGGCGSWFSRQVGIEGAVDAREQHLDKINGLVRIKKTLIIKVEQYLITFCAHLGSLDPSNSSTLFSYVANMSGAHYDQYWSKVCGVIFEISR